MPQREFANQKALLSYAERNALVYAWERSPAFARRQRLLSPEQYEIVEVRTSRGISRALLFSQAILLAEWEANAPLREAKWTLDQALLLPPSVHDFVPAGHLSRFVVALVTEELDLSTIMASYKGEPTGGEGSRRNQRNNPMRSKLPMHPSPRCGARTRSGSRQRCRTADAGCETADRRRALRKVTNTPTSTAATPPKRLPDDTTLQSCRLWLHPMSADGPVTLRYSPSRRTSPHSRPVPLADPRTCSKQPLYSITSSARSSSDVGMSMPSALAVLRLRRSSTFYR
jgi:hypothetical protein